ncbi:hypothetical protein [Clostridium sp. Marseille-Q7071]
MEVKEETKQVVKVNERRRILIDLKNYITSMIKKSRALFSI